MTNRQRAGRNLTKEEEEEDFPDFLLRHRRKLSAMTRAFSETHTQQTRTHTEKRSAAVFSETSRGEAKVPASPMRLVPIDTRYGMIGGHRLSNLATIDQSDTSNRRCVNVAFTSIYVTSDRRSNFHHVTCRVNWRDIRPIVTIARIFTVT